MTGERILIVDDSDDIRDIVINHVLKPYAYDYLEARDGLEALELIQSGAPDLVLLDLKLPHMSGLELLHRLQEQAINIPVILMTSHGSEGVAVEVFRLGVKDYVAKPFTKNELLKSIDTTLEEAKLLSQRDQLTEGVTSLNTSLQTQVDRFERLADLGGDLMQIDSPDPLLIRALEIAGLLVESREITLLMRDAASGALFQRASWTEDDTRLTNRVADSPLAADAVSTGAARLGDPQVDETFEAFTVQVCVPASAGGTAIALCATLPAGEASEHLLSVFKILGDYTAANLERLRLMG